MIKLGGPGAAPSCAAQANALRICGCRTLRFVKSADFDFAVSHFSSQEKVLVLNHGA
jgi:hypothetical protein